MHIINFLGIIEIWMAKFSI